MLTYQTFQAWFRRVANLQEGTDVDGTIQTIQSGAQLSGVSVWILACSAVIASIGLDQDSAAVIIGAMLISPLMSPILSIGLSIGINDRKHLLEALRSFAVAVGASLFLSFLYFLLTPLGTINPSIAARTEPTLLDVLVAFTGGVAGIVAGSRKEKTTAIPGVAIATALMPPLCVAGFGLATGSWAVFLGAFYLFFINSVFIALSTYLIVRLLQFPFVSYQEEEGRRKALRGILAFCFIIALPSGYLFVKVIQRYQTNSRIDAFITKEVNNDFHQAMGYKVIDRDSVVQVNLFMTGASLSEDSVEYLHQRLADYRLTAIRLNFVQNLPPVSENKLVSQARNELLSELQPILLSQAASMDSLKRNLSPQQVSTPGNIDQLQSELFRLYPDLAQFAFTEMAVVCKPGQKLDTLPAIVLTWKPEANRIKAQEEQLQKWLPSRLQADSCLIIAR